MKKLFTSVLASALIIPLLFSSEYVSAKSNDQFPSIDASTIIKQSSEATKTLSTLKESNKTKSFNQLTEEYNLKDIDSSQIPSNIGVIKVNSPKELEALLKDINESSVQQEKTTVYQNNAIKQAISPLSSEYKVRKTKSVSAGASKITLYADIWLRTGDYDITSVQKWTSLSGVTVGFGWKQNSLYHHLSSDKKTLDVYASGSLQYYIEYPNGSKKVASKDVDLHIHYDAPSSSGGR